MECTRLDKMLLCFSGSEKTYKEESLNCEVGLRVTISGVV